MSVAGSIAAERLLDGLSTAVLLLDGDDHLVFLNAAAEDLLGVSRRQATGRPFAAALLDGGGVLEPMLERVRAAAAPYAAREVSLRTRTDVLRVVDCQIAPFEESRMVLIELIDASGRLRISREATLLAQHGGSRTMIRQLAHEIKNPLGGLRGAAQLLERELPDEGLREYTRVIVGEADRLATLVDSLLGPARPLQRQASNVHELLERVRQLVLAEAPPAVGVECDYDPSLPLAALDRDQVIQAMLNLARNGVQAVGRQGRLLLRTRALSNVTIGETRHRLAASVEFEDDGPGVPEQLRETLFYPFITGRPGGTGLGLALAQELANRHGGLIEFESRPGRTVFRLLLPIGEDGD